MKILVNCALPYANGSLHLGHVAGAYLNADIFVRFQRMNGNEVLFISGSDEYGTAITIAADRLKVSPGKIADKYHREHEESFRSLDIVFDLFSRTTYQEHENTVKEFFLDFYHKGLLVERSMVSPFCRKCDRFMPDRYIEGICPNCGFEEARGDQCDNCGRTLDPQELKSPRCIICGETPEFRETKHMFFQLERFQDQLLQWIGTKSFWRHNVLSFTRNFIKSGLKERPITRDIEWGVPVPLQGYEHKRIYVWFEALIGYVSAARIYSEKMGEENYWKEFYKNPDVKVYHFMGKDNITFHTIIWPAMLMARGDYNLPYMVTANEYLTYKGKQFSKSRGIGFSVDEIIKVVPKDYVRYYTASILPEGADTDFTLEELQSKVNTELIDKFGNYVHRLVSFITNNKLQISSQGVISDDRDLEAMSFAEDKIRAFSGYVNQTEIKKAMGEWLELVKYANGYFNQSEPWRLIKSDRNKCISKLYHSLVLAQYICGISYPVIPSTSKKVLEIIGSSKFRETGFTDNLFVKENSEFSPVKTDPPFQKLDLLEKNPNCLDLRIGQIKEVNNHSNADKLYVLKVDLGYREAQIVAGLRNYYTPDELVGMKIVVVDNLKWAKLRGEESQGMLLAADDGETVSVLTPADSAASTGGQVRIGNLGYNSSGKIDMEQILKMKLQVEENDGIPAATAEIDGLRVPLTVAGSKVVSQKNVKIPASVR
ncbi:MAG: methionine--tRNA ligase [Candidatus Thermoplasmatota archaeon]|nr:methionine--tRNA ligase [Candidatus Thermoplasmatota archaeon]